MSDKWGPAELLGGGTDLLDRTKDYVSEPDAVVSLTGIGGAFRELRSAAPPGAFPPDITIGAGTHLTDIAESRLLAMFPALTTAAAQVAGPQIRNMATLGGNLCQRNRCWYFRDEHVHCLLKGGRKCFAQEGENQYHAIFTQGHPCVIVNPSSLAPPLIALGAVADILGPKGTRELPLEKMYQAPVKETQREHVLAPNEILVSVRFGGAGSRSSRRTATPATRCGKRRRPTGRWSRRRWRTTSSAAATWPRACGWRSATSPRPRC